jgi:peptidyl-prolyl cis-trans isomerase D
LARSDTGKPEAQSEVLLLESFRKGQRWLTFIFVSVIGLVFVFFFGTGGGLQGSTPTGNAIVELDDVRLTSIDLAREKERTEAELRGRLGDSYDEVGADRYIDSQALNTLLNNVVFAAAAEDLGLHVTKDELRQIVQSSAGFVDDQGRFDPEAFDFFARRNFGNQRLFIQYFTRQLLQQKLVQLLASQTDVSDSEIDLVTRYEGEEVRIAFVGFDPNVLPDGLEITEAEVEAYAAEHTGELEMLYEQRAAELAIPERVRARHILIRLAEDAPSELEEAARESANAARERLVAGEEFEIVSAELSQDAGTADKGGELGLFARGRNDAALDDAAFALEVGGLSDLVRSPYGFHIIRVDEKLAAETPSFAEHRNALARESIEQARARELADQRSAELVAAIQAGTSLEDAARAAGLTLERPAAIRRRSDGYIAGLGAATEAMNAAFSLPAGQSSSEIYDVGGRKVLIQVLERTEPSPEEIETARSSRREQLLLQKQNQVISAWLADFRLRLEESGRLRVNAELALGS